MKFAYSFAMGLLLVMFGLSGCGTSTPAPASKEKVNKVTLNDDGKTTVTFLGLGEDTFHAAYPSLRVFIVKDEKATYVGNTSLRQKYKLVVEVEPDQEHTFIMLTSSVAEVKFTPKKGQNIIVGVTGARKPLWAFLGSAKFVNLNVISDEIIEKFNYAQDTGEVHGTPPHKAAYNKYVDFVKENENEPAFYRIQI